MKVFALLLVAIGSDGPQFTATGDLAYPTDYREWVFLSSGAGMTYGPAAATHADGTPLFDNVFVNPGSYREFLKTGKWKNGTEFILEIRNSESHGSINKDGHFQAGMRRFESEVKNERGEWKFYSFAMENGKPKGNGTLLPATASCYSCHGKNTAVENTFVQFYPTLMEVAERLGSVKKEYVR